MKLFINEKYEEKVKVSTGNDASLDQVKAGDQQYSTYIFESISVMFWIIHGAPFLARKYFTEKKKFIKLYYIDGSKLGVRLAGLTARIFKISFKRLEFLLVDIKDEKNDLYWFHIFTDELPALLNKIKDSVSYQNIVNQLKIKDRLPNYLYKRILDIDPTVINKRLARLLLLFQVITLKFKDTEKLYLIVKKTLWFSQIKIFAKNKGIALITLEKINFKILRFEFIRRPVFKKCYHILVYYGRRIMLLARSKNPFHRSDEQDYPSQRSLKRSTSSLNGGPKLAVEYYGHLNLDAPELFSDLFFWQTSCLSGEDVVVYSQISLDPIDRKKYYEMRRHKMYPLALNLKAAVTSDVPIARYPKKAKRKDSAIDLLF